MVPGEDSRGSAVSGVSNSSRVVWLTPPCSVGLGYFPPSSNFEKLEVFVKKFPIYKYQLYFASKGCVAELEKNVRTISIFGRMTAIRSHRQII